MHALKLISGQYLDLGENPTLTLNEANPIFDPQRINRSWSYPLTVPRNAKNVMALGGAGRIDAVLGSAKEVATLYLEGVPYDTGVLLITGSSNKSINLTFQNLSVDLADQLGRIRFRDLALPEEITTPFTPILYMAARRPNFQDAYNVLFVVNGIRYVADFTEPQQLVDQVNTDYPGLLELTSFTAFEHFYTCRPTPEHGALRFDITTQVELDTATGTVTASLTLEDTNYNDEATRINDAFRTTDTETEETPYRLPTIYAPSFYDGKNPDWAGVMNLYDPATENYAEEEYPEDYAGGWVSAILPQPRVAVLLEKALANIGYRLSGSLATDADLRELLLYNNHDLTTSLETLGPDMASDLPISDVGITAEDLNYFVVSPSFSLGDYTPDITCQELLQLFAESFAHVILIDTGSVKLTPIDELLRVAPTDITSKIDPLRRTSYGQPKGIVLDYERQGDDNIYPGQLEREQIGDATDANEYPLPVFSTFEESRDLQVAGETYRVRIPVVDEVGRNEFYDVGNTPRLRFFFHRGLRSVGGASSSEGEYPQAGHSLFSYENEAAGRYSMNWLGDGGLYPTWHRRLIRLLQHGTTDRRLVRLTVADLLELRTWRNARVSYRTPEGTTVAIVKSFRVKSTAAGLGIADVTFQLEPS